MQISQWNDMLQLIWMLFIWFVSPGIVFTAAIKITLILIRFKMLNDRTWCNLTSSLYTSTKFNVTCTFVKACICTKAIASAAFQARQMFEERKYKQIRRLSLFAHLPSSSNWYICSLYQLRILLDCSVFDS